MVQWIWFPHENFYSLSITSSVKYRQWENEHTKLFWLPIILSFHTETRKKPRMHLGNHTPGSRFVGFYCFTSIHDYVIKWKLFSRCWPFVRGIHRSPVMFDVFLMWVRWIIRMKGGLRLHDVHVTSSLCYRATSLDQGYWPCLQRIGACRHYKYYPGLLWKR